MNRKPPTSFRFAAALLALASTPLGALARLDASVEKADSLVGTSVEVKNVYRSTGGITITKLQSERDVAAASKALQSALSKYPASFVTRVLKTVYIGADVKHADNGKRESWGGLYRPSDLTIFMNFDGNPKNFEQTFHHELAHGIHCAYQKHFDEKAWLAANPPNFHYQENRDGRPPSPELLRDGFARPYATCSLREDVACLAERLVGDTENFAKVAANNPRLKRKATLLIALYKAVDPLMTERYFRLQDAADDQAPQEDVSDERGRPLLVSPQAVKGAFIANFKEGDRVTLLYRDRRRRAGPSEITFEPRSPAHVTLCRRRKAREEPELTVLARLPRMTRDTPFSYLFKDDCAAVLRMDGEQGEDRVRYEFQIQRKGE
jgi:hypothetical protein